MPKVRGKTSGKTTTVKTTISTRSRANSITNSEASTAMDMELVQSEDTTLLVYGASQFGVTIREQGQVYSGWVIEHLTTSGADHFVSSTLGRPNRRILIADLYTDWCVKNPNLTEWRRSAENFQTSVTQALLEILTARGDLQVQLFLFLNALLEA